MQRELYGIQGLRFLAAALVVATHSTFYTAERLGGMPVWPSGARGVDIFFVISGFVMIWSSAKLIGTADGWKIFASKRVRRIVPMYWLATTVKLAMMLAAGGLVLHSQLDLPTIVKSYVFLPSRQPDGTVEPLLGVGWTLVFEMFFYAVFAVALATRRNVYLVVGAVLTICSVGSLFRPDNYPVWMYYLDSIVLEFFFGMILAHWTMAGRRLPTPLACVLLVVGMALILTSPGIFYIPRALQCGVPALMVVSAVVSLETQARVLLPLRTTNFLGGASYATYLFHPMIAPFGAVLLKRAHLALPWLSVLLCWTIGIAVGCLVYQFVERRLYAWLPGTTRRPAAQAPAE